MKFEFKRLVAMHYGIYCSRSGTEVPDLDPLQIWNFAYTDLPVFVQLGYFYAPGV